MVPVFLKRHISAAICSAEYITVVTSPFPLRCVIPAPISRFVHISSDTSFFAIVLPSHSSDRYTF